MDKPMLGQKRGERTAHALKSIYQMVTGAILAVIVSYVAWTFANWDIVWKAMRYPEAIRQMQIEIVIKK